MRSFKCWIEAALAFLSLGAFAQGATFDVNAGLLTLPAVKVGSATYTNVLLGLINPANYTFRLQAATPQAPAGPADITFDGNTGLLTIPSVSVGSALYVNVTLHITEASTYTFILTAATLQHPSISNLRYSPATAVQTPNGSVSVTGTIDFADDEGDISFLRFVTSAGADLTVPTPALSGVTSGTGVGYFVISTDKIGHYTFEIWLVDSTGNASNRLAGTFDVVADDTATRWTELNVFVPRTLLGIGENGRQYVAVGSDGTIMTTPDLNNWTVQTAPVPFELRSIAWSGSRWVAVGDNGTGQAAIISSIDGLSWAVQAQAGTSCPPTCSTARYWLSKVIWTGTQFVAVGEERVYPGPLSYALIATSPDGVSWAQRALRTIRIGSDDPGDSGMKSVAWSGGQLVAVGIGPDSYPTAWTSIDAEQWTPRNLPGYGGQILRDVTWGNGRFVAIGFGGRPFAFVSADGITWQGNSGDFVPAMNAIATGPSRYVAVSNTYRATSNDGVQWTDTPAFSACGNGVLWDGNRYVSVGGSICTSP